jgi:fibro-slime domain-containing protein
MNSSGFISAQSARRVAALLGVSLLAAGTAFGQDPPASVDLPVVIRDFSKSHPDFAVVPADGYAYYAGNVAFDLDTDGKPVFTGGGFKAKSLWKNIDGKPIAPHLFNTCKFLTPIGGSDSGAASFGLAVDEKLKVDDESVVDSFDSNLGPYGGENAGASALVQVNGTGKRKRVVRVKDKAVIMGDVMVGPDLDLKRAVKVEKKGRITGEIGHLEAPVEMLQPAAPELGPSVGKVQYKRGQHTLSADLHCEKLKLKKRAILNIEGDVTIFCDEKLELKDRSEIRLMPDSTLTLYVGEKIQLKRGSKLNMNTGDPQLVSIYMLGVRDDDDDSHDDDSRDDDSGDDQLESKVDLDRNSRMVAWLQGASTSLKVDNRSQFYGAFMGRKVEVDDGSRLHVDMAVGSGGTTVVYEPEECELGDRAGVINVISDGDVLSAGTFAEWWRDILGTNMSTIQTITMNRNRYGVYFYLADNYRPIEGELLGNEGDVHNYHFTVEMDAKFTYDAAATQWFEIRCTDDAYLFINGRMVIDLGGYGFNKVQFVDLDRLGLEDGRQCRLQLFHAQRQRGLAIFRLRTNIVLEDNSGSPSVNAILED